MTGVHGARIVTLAAAIAAALAVTACSRSPGDSSAQTVTDLAGRSVEITLPATAVCAIGPGALRLVCYVGAAGKVVGIEKMEKQWSGGRPYILAAPELLDLPVIGQGGPDSSPDPEALIGVGPSVIFAAYLVDASKADELEEKTGVPVVVLSYGQLGTFDHELLESIALVGRITGSEARASEVVEFIRGCEKDLGGRTAGIEAERRPTVYAGCISMKGTHGIESTQASFPPFAAINARNVVDETGRRGSLVIDKEQLLEWDPEFIFIDQSGWPMLRDDHAESPGLYQALQAVRNGDLYGYLPYNYYATNVDTAIADAYFVGTVIYPDAFQDIDPVARAREIYRFLVGEDMYDAMSREFGGFTKLSLAGP
jgi:iron complex transport system substrate-binding protein